MISLVYTPSIRSVVPNVHELNGGYGYSLIRFNEAETVGNTDILFIGSSHCYRGFDPRIFAKQGIRSFNLGSAAQTPINTYYLYKRFSNNISSKLVVIETYWAVLTNPDGIESTIDLLSNMELSEENVEMVLEAPNIRSINSLIYSFFSQTLDQDRLSVSNQTEYRKNTYIPGGYVETSRVLDEKKMKKIRAAEAKLYDKQLHFLEKTIQLAIDNGSRVVLIRAPVTEELLKSVLNYDDTYLPIKRVAEKYNLSHLDLNEDKHRVAMGLTSKKHFYDAGHMNKHGVVIMNEHITEFLTEELLATGK